MARLISVAPLLSAVRAWNLPTDCRNHTVSELGGDLAIMSWHIHYTTDRDLLGEMRRFYEAFVAKFADRFPDEKFCPIGPNYGSYSSDLFPAKTMCSLAKMEFELAAGVDDDGNPWGTLTQAAFFIPIEFIDEAWAWAKENRGELDIIKHPNTGCMTDDHKLLSVWAGKSHPIKVLDFPCNVPGTGCIDNDYPAFNCGCAGTRQDDSPESSCGNCVLIGELPPETVFA